MTVRWTDAAYADLEDIYLYIAEDNPRAAARVVDHIEAYANRELSQFPLRGRTGRVDDTRELVVADYPNYIVAYEVIGEDIDILAVVHGRRRWPASFR
jgi:addiction module RelE/StbE family toxin